MSRGKMVFRLRCLAEQPAPAAGGFRTSGMKASCHGALTSASSMAGGAKATTAPMGSPSATTRIPTPSRSRTVADSENLYKTLTEEIIPCFFNRDANGIPRQWIQKIRRAMVTLVPQFNTWRMVQEYTQRFYSKP